MKVPVIDLKRHLADMEEEVLGAVRHVVESGYYILGPEVKGFEEEAARYLGAPFAIGVGNGTDAISLALAALDCKPGDEVITTPFTFIASAETLALAGAVPVFADVGGDFNMLPEAVEEKIGPKTKGILLVHLFGQCARAERMKEIADRHGLWMVEDAAQGFGATRNGRMCGTVGQLGTYSFFPTKNLGAMGDGGLVVTGDDTLAEKVRALRVHGSYGGKYRHDTLGYNSRLDEMQAAILRVKLKRLDGWCERRRAIAARYDEVLSGIVKTPVVTDGNRHIYHQYTIIAEQRDELKAHLAERGVGAGIHYPRPLHLQPAFAYLGLGDGACPTAEELSGKVLALPVFPEMTDDEVEYVADNVKTFYT